MKIDVMRSQDRGYKKINWLESYHSFSFSDYYNPQRMGFRSLRVINEDWIAPSKGFATHPHDNMEIFTYVVEGALAHQDSMGNTRSILPGMFQRMSAGTGISHSEFNPSSSETAHILQIWIDPKTRNLEPSYEDCPYPMDKNCWTCLLGPTGISRVDQDLALYRADLEKHALSMSLKPNQAFWIQVVKGTLEVLGHSLSAGDALNVSANPQEQTLQFKTTDRAEFLLFHFMV